MKILMIHEVEPWMLELDLSEFDIITFDDGLYSQYKNYKHFLKFNKPLYFFISTYIVCEEDEVQNEDTLSCSLSHKLFFENNDKTNYMKWSQIKEIYNTSNCYIGGHSHRHLRFKDLPLKEQVNKSALDIFKMMQFFNEHGIKISTFCYPYNEEVIGYVAALRKYNINVFFGNERISIESLKN